MEKKEQSQTEKGSCGEDSSTSNGYAFFHGLTPAEHERLAILSEEMGETQQIIGKILRHGYESYHPLAKSPTNREMLEKEIGDVLIAIGMLVAGEDIKERTVERHMDLKGERIAKYLHHQKV